ncbi:MAG: hypothetical protein QXP60_05620 [Nitrososphaerota archaeon]
MSETDGTPSDISDGNFTITETAAITVASPNGGERWIIGTQVTVVWTSGGSVGNVNIDLSTNSGSSWTNLVNNTANDGSQTITVPDTPSTACRVRVINISGSVSDISNSNFYIVNSTQLFSHIPYFNDPQNYQPLNPSRWEVAYNNGDWRYFLNISSYSNLSGSRLGEYSLVKDRMILY